MALIDAIVAIELVTSALLLVLGSIGIFRIITQYRERESMNRFNAACLLAVSLPEPCAYCGYDTDPAVICSACFAQLEGPQA